MSQVRIIGSGSPVAFDVVDKTDAIRKLATRLLTTASRSSVEDALNDWLSSSMQKDLRLKIGSEVMTISYID